MSLNWNKTARLSALGAFGSLAVWLGTSSAKEESVLVLKPAAVTEKQVAPALPPPANPNELSATPLYSPQQTQQTGPAPKRPFMRPAEPRDPVQAQFVAEESMPPPPGSAPVNPAPGIPEAAPLEDEVNVQPTPPIDYDTDRDARRMYRTGKIDRIMLTKDPTNGCAYEIPMCIPACCEGDPKVSGGRGIFGRGIVEYCWPCGFRAIVKFRHILGDVKVEYEGD